MAKGHRKWVSGVLSAAVISSMLAFPQFSHAESKMNLEEELLNAKKLKVIRQLEQHYDGQQKQSSKALNTRNTLSAESTAVTEQTYTGTLAENGYHAYAFTVTQAGTVQMDKGANADQYEALIFNVNALDPSPEDLQPIGNGESIAPGEYILMTIGADQVQYNLKLSGFTFEGTNVLPKLTVTSPSQTEVRLAKNAKSLTVSGDSDSEVTIHTSSQETPVMAPAGPFSKSVPVQLGYNAVDVEAVNTDGNLNGKMYDVMVPGIERIAGANRYEVSANISKKIPVLSDTVIVARGELFPDALSGGPLASLEAAPVLLTRSNNLEAPIKAEIQRRQPKRVIILGGTGAVSATVESQIKSALNNDVVIDRIAGADRYEVSKLIAERLMNIDPEFKSDSAFLASGLDFPDALAASSPAGQFFSPVLLTKKDFMPASIESFVKAHNEINTYFLVGGTGVIGTQVEQKLKSLGKQVIRLGGSTRYETATIVADFFGLHLGGHNVVSRGDLFPDALSGGPLASYSGAPIILTRPTAVDKFTAEYFGTYGAEVITILGGVGAVSADVEKQLSSYIP
ncbi:cell wall-binding repeat-containing protein [Lihuaxuella thermophila]|uniref:Putative cell wall binding repeat 2 n=1 Tax=Lihuaxuella thermophila TaxID=1173111 RepID=A0A1H8BGG7_9BACL|nr:cell wall-binding repeat-containing protein [Lihuaxuella thermophila]SEM81856.1 Putative cell wall binding repeat 2 [Lihuaxuella thermophila]